MKRWSVCLAVGLALLGHSPAAANLVINGDFATAVPTNATGGGWTNSNENPTWGWEAGIGNPAPGFLLNEFGSVSTDPTLLQVVTGLVVGTQYQFSGDYISYARNQSPASATDSFRALLDGNVVFMAGPTAVIRSGNPSAPWSSFSVLFTATATSTTLELKAECNGSDNDFGVDNISIAPFGATPTGQSTWGRIKHLYR